MSNRRLLFFFFPLFFFSCISNKKHQAALDLINTQHQTELTELQKEVDTANNTIKEQELNIAERIGENNILLMLRGELQEEITTLESNIENLSNTSSSAQKNLSADLAQKDNQIKQLKKYLQEVELTIVEHENIIKSITGDLNYIAQDYPDDIEVNLGFDFATIDIKESFLFKKYSTTRLLDPGNVVLEKFSEIFQKFPNIKVQVIAHTDTAPPRDKKRYGDNWNYSALQSATVVRTLIDDYDVSANQLMLAAKAEFAPKASNATTEGKLQNRRIELYIITNAEDLAKKIRSVIAQLK